MEELFVDKTKELIKEKERLQDILKVSISVRGRKVTIDGEPLDEFQAQQVIEAIGMGFSAKEALVLINDDVLFERINIKDHTRKKDLEPVRARLIGTHGKTKKTIEEISGCKIEINGNAVGIIGPAATIQYAITGVANVIKGTKQANVYHYLEKINRDKK